MVVLLPGNNPLVQALLPVKAPESFADSYRSVRAQLLGAGADTIYYFTDVMPAAADSEVPGYFVLPGTAESLQRLRDGLAAAGHADLVEFLAGFRPVPEAPGWLVSSHGASPEGHPDPDRARKLERAFAVSGSLTPATVTPKGPAYVVGLDRSWPFSVAVLEPSNIGRVVAPLLAATGSPFGGLAERVPTATAGIFSEAVAPLPFQRLVLTFPNTQAAHEFAAEIGRAANAIMDAIRGSEKDWVDDFNPLEIFLRSTLVVRTQNEDVAVFNKPPIFLDAEREYETGQRMQDQDWTALRPPDGYQWELLALPGLPIRYDVLGRVRGVRVQGGERVRGEAEAAEGDRRAASRFRIPLARGESLTLTVDRRGNLSVAGPRPAMAPVLPTLDLLDEGGACLAVLRLGSVLGDPRVEVYRTRSLLQERLKSVSEALARAQAELNEAKAQMKKEVAAAPGGRRRAVSQQWQQVIAARQRQLPSAPLLNYLLRVSAPLQRQYPLATLVPRNDPPPAPSVDPLLAKHEHYPFAGQWLFGSGALVTLHQEAGGRVAGTLAGQPPKGIMGLPEGVLNEQAIVSGTADGRALNMTWFDVNGTQEKGRFVLGPDGRSGTWEGITGPVRIDRIDTGLPEASWFQDQAGNFEGSWVNAARRYDNTTLKQVQPGCYEGWINQGLNEASAKGWSAGNVIFLLHGSPAMPRMRKATLSPDGKSLSFVVPGGGLIRPQTIQLLKE
jgi:hypothetical protein